VRAPVLFALLLALAAAAGFGWALRGAVQPAASARASAAELSRLTPAALQTPSMARPQGTACSWRI
jgi:hypothetical protein